MTRLELSARFPKVSTADLNRMDDYIRLLLETEFLRGKVAGYQESAEIDRKYNAELKKAVTA